MGTLAWGSRERCDCPVCIAMRLDRVTRGQAGAEGPVLMFAGQRGQL